MDRDPYRDWHSLVFDEMSASIPIEHIPTGITIGPKVFRHCAEACEAAIKSLESTDWEELVYGTPEDQEATLDDKSNIS